MIGSLRGKIEFFDNYGLLVDVNGVGYRVRVSNKVLNSFKTGEEIKLFTYTHVREDQLELFGFTDIADLQLFTLLINVNGIGPKTALLIFSIGNKEEILSAIRSANVDFFTRVPRLGSKNAQKIIIDLKSKVKGTGKLDLSLEQNRNQEVEQALKGFGFSEKEIKKALFTIEDKNLESAEIIKMTLKYLGK